MEDIECSIHNYVQEVHSHISRQMDYVDLSKNRSFSPQVICASDAVSDTELAIETVIVKQGKLNQYNLCRLPAGLTGIILSLLLCEKLGAWGAMIGCLGGWMVSVGSALWLIRDVMFPTAAARPFFG